MVGIGAVVRKRRLNIEGRHRSVGAVIAVLLREAAAANGPVLRRQPVRLVIQMLRALDEAAAVLLPAAYPIRGTDL